MGNVGKKKCFMLKNSQTLVKLFTGKAPCIKMRSILGGKKK